MCGYILNGTDNCRKTSLQSLLKFLSQLILTVSIGLDDAAILLRSWCADASVAANG